MKPSKRLAGVAALATVAAGVSMVIGSSAANAAAPGTLTCNTGGNGASFASTWNDTNTFTLSPAVVGQGGTETVTWTSAAGLVNGSPVALGAGSTQVQVVAALTGATTGNVVATTPAGTYPTVTTASGSPLGPITATGTFTASTVGTINATVSFIDFNSNSVDTYCSLDTDNTQFPATGSALVPYISTPAFQTPTGLPSPGDAGSFATNNVNYGDLQVSAGAVGFASASATVTAPVILTRGQVTGEITGVNSYVAKNDSINLTGSGWPASTASSGFTAALCNTALTSCDANQAAANITLASDASGNLTGAVQITGSPTVGARALKITAGASSQSLTYTVLGAPTVSIAPAAGPAGSVTAVTATGFQPNSYGFATAVIPNTLGDVTGGTFAAYGNINGNSNIGTGGGNCTGAGTSSTGPDASCVAVGPDIPGAINTRVAFTASATGSYSGNVTVTDPKTADVEVAQKVICTGPGTITPQLPTAGVNANCTTAGTNADAVTTSFGNLSMGFAKLATWSFDVATCTRVTSNSPLCNTNQHVYASILAGSLTQTITASANNPDSGTTFNIQLCAGATGPTAPITLANGKLTPCAVAVPSVVTTYSGQLNPVTVSDTRGGTTGWTLTATAPNLTDASSHVISNSLLTITPACAVDATAPGSALGITAGAANQPFSGTVTLCTKDATTLNAGATTGGLYDITTAGNGVQLAVPAFQAPGNYTTNMTINLT
jgi:hypothetical protein